MTVADHDADGDERWRQHLREQLYQRSKDDARIQRLLEKQTHLRRIEHDGAGAESSSQTTHRDQKRHKTNE